MTKKFLRNFFQPRGSTDRRVIWLRIGTIVVLSFVIGTSLGSFLASTRQQLTNVVKGDALATNQQSASSGDVNVLSNGRPKLSPLPPPQEVWNCEVVVVGGSLGGVAAASHAMQSGAKTCLIELTPWLGGQISSQGVSAIDESYTTWVEQGFSESWNAFKRLIKQQVVDLPDWVKLPPGQRVEDLSSCWVGKLCFLPRAGATASVQLLQAAAAKAPGSRWSTETAFKGADFDATGKEITAVYAVHRVPRDPNYVPSGRLSAEITGWYGWDADATFNKIPIRLQAPPGKRLIVIDATDTGEVVAWAGIPYRLGAESVATTGERRASKKDNPDCTQAFTYPFVLAIHNDQGKSLAALSQVKSDYPEDEHGQEFNLKNFPMFSGKSFFNYRRIVSTQPGHAFTATPAIGDMTLVNWNTGNDWNWMDPPLILNEQQIAATGQHRNWLGGISPVALKHAENHALLFAKWLLENQTQPGFPLAYFSGPRSPMGTVSGLSLYPYIREGRRILGRKAYGQRDFAMREADVRHEVEGRDFNNTSIGVAHYAVDIHGCRYRDWSPSWEASSAPVKEHAVRPFQIPLESLIPQEIDNLMIGGKSLAVTHIVNAITRIHYSEWTIGAAAGSTAGWLITQPKQPLEPGEIVPRRLMPTLQRHLIKQGLRLAW